MINRCGRWIGILSFALLSTLSETATSVNRRAEAGSCAALRAASFADTEIVTAEPVQSGAFTPPGDWDAATKAILRELPAFCRVVGLLRPTADSAIGFELWLPDRWNGRYLQVGNAGFAGVIVYAGLIQGLQNGFAVAGTDDGHVGEDTGWMLGHPEKVIDYGYRAVHMTSVTAKQIVSAYYQGEIPYSYFSGCSTGGREGLMEAQRYPDDFDGWIVGAPASNWVGLMTRLLSTAQMQTGLTEPVTPMQLKALSRAVIQRCDAADGVIDGVIDQPLQCHFDPDELLCKGKPDGFCLTKTQAGLVRRTYDDLRDLKTHASLVPGRQGSRGVEAEQWEFLSGTDLNSFMRQITDGFWPKLVYGDPAVDYRRLDALQAFKDAESRIAPLISSLDPDLASLRASGKKIIQYHGWADAAVPAQYSIAYLEAVEHYLGEPNQDFYRLFLAPGMMHCWAGPGPNVFGGAYTPGGIFDPDHHALAALIQWVEKGQAPDRIIATKYDDDDPTRAIIRTRPLCPYPSVARWTGQGSTDDAKNFACSTGAVHKHL